MRRVIVMSQRETGIQAICEVKQAEKCSYLLNSSEKFQSEEAHFASTILPEYPGDDRGRLTGNDTGRSWRRSGDRQMDDLVLAEMVSRGDTGAGRTNIQRLGQFNEFSSGCICGTQKNGHL